MVNKKRQTYKLLRSEKGDNIQNLFIHYPGWHKKKGDYSQKVTSLQVWEKLWVVNEFLIL